MFLFLIFITSNFTVLFKKSENIVNYFLFEVLFYPTLQKIMML